MFYTTKHTSLLISGILLSFLSATVNATLVGDTVFIRQVSDRDGSGLVYLDEVDPVLFPIESAGPVVEGDMDKTYLAGTPSDPAMSIDVDSSSFSLEFYGVYIGWGSYGDVFAGYEISDFDYEPGWIITGVTLHNNLVGWDGGPVDIRADLISFTDDSILLNFADNGFLATGTLDFEITFAAVPLPPAIWLFVTGLAGIAGFGRMNQKR